MSRLSVAERLANVRPQNVPGGKAFGKEWKVDESRGIAICKGQDNQFMVSAPDGLRIVTLPKGKELA